jgi:hypothetical protein
LEIQAINLTGVMTLPCAFCGTTDRIEEAHVKDEHILKKLGLNVASAKNGNIIPLCHQHHRHYFDCPRTDQNGRGENREFQFEPKLIIDISNRNLILYNEKKDDNTLQGLLNSVTVQPMYQYDTSYHVRRKYVAWKNKRMNPRLKFYAMNQGLLKDLLRPG